MKTKFTFLVLLWSLQITSGQTYFFKNLAEHHPDISTGTAQPASQIRHADIVLQSLDSIYYKDWDQGLNDWVNNNKDVFTYDNTGNIIDITSQNWDLSTNTWENDFETIYTYNVNGKISSVEMLGWNGAIKTWESNMKTLFTYDTNGFLIEEIYQNWDNTQWIDDEKDVFTYDSQGLMTERIRYENSNGNLSRTVDWVPYRKYLNVYDSNNRLSEKTVFNWDDTNQVWTKNYKNVYTYQNDLLMSAIEYQWDSGAMAYQKYSKIEDIYDVDSYLIEETEYNWNGTNQQWVFEDQTVYTRDAQHNITEEIYKFWQNNAWINSDRYVRNYNNNFSYGDLLLPKYYYDFEIADILKLWFVHQITDETDYRWDYSINGWRPDVYSDLYYSPNNITGISSTAQIKAKIFPNPFTQSVQIQLPENLSQSQFRLYDLTGKQIMSVKISQNGMVNLPKLEQYIYLYKISGKGFEQTGKLIRK